MYLTHRERSQNKKMNIYERVFLCPQKYTFTNRQKKNAAQVERLNKQSITQTNFDFLPQGISDFIQLANAHLKAVFFLVARYGALLGSYQLGQFFLA